MPAFAQFAAEATLPEIIGVIGFGLSVLNYSLLTLRRVTNDQVRYHVLNICAAACVLTGLMVHFNLAAAMVQTFWIAISSVGIVLRLYERARAGRSLTLGALRPQRVAANWIQLFICPGEAAFATHNARAPADEYY